TLGGPGGDKLNGNCTFVTTTSFTAADGITVANDVPVSVPFTAGNLIVSLEPNDTAIPSGTSYQMNCVAPSQTITGADGKTHRSSGSWGPWTLVVKSPPNSSALSDVKQPEPPTPGTIIPVAWISGVGFQPGQTILWTGTSWVATYLNLGYSIDLTQPST